MSCLLPIVTSSGLVVAQADLTGSARDLDEVYTAQSSRSFTDTFNDLFGGKPFNKSYALVIGVSDYKSGWNDLPQSLKDAKRVSEYLKQDAGFDYVITLTNGKATKSRIDKLMIEEFPRMVGQEDRFLFYYSGHGTQRILGNVQVGYLPLQESGTDTYSDMISMEDVERWDRLLSQAKQTLYIIDSCFSGLAGIQTKSALSEKRLDRLSQYGHHLITAGTKDEESVAGALWNGSLFTDALLRGVSGRADTASGDYGKDGVVSLKELMKYIEDRIDAESVRLKQRNFLKKEIKMSPQLSHLKGDNEGEFFFIASNNDYRPADSDPIYAEGDGITNTKGLANDGVREDQNAGDALSCEGPIAEQHFSCLLLKENR